MSASEVADAIGISVDDATRALHELRSLGYAREEKRRYLPTERGREAHASRANARREALAESISHLSEADRRALARALGAVVDG
jgi:DNA-binding MarR family transcriptional regulator